MSIVDLKDVPVGGGDPSTGLEGRSPSPASRGGLTECGQIARAAGDGGQGSGRPTVVDVPMRAQRSLATVTAEIRAYQDAARRMAVQYSIEIGRRLIEAKEMVCHGEWGAYLREELGFSQSTANNHMALFRAYAADQMRLDGDNLKNQAFGNLTYTQALALLALPSEEEREAFVESHDMAGLPTRELQTEIARLREEKDAVEADAREINARKRQAEARAEEADKQCLSLQNALTVMQKERKADEAHWDELKEQAREACAARDEALKAQDAAQKASAEAERKAQAAAEAMTKAQKELAEARKAEKQALQALKKAKADKTVPAETLEQLRREAEEAARKALEAESGGKSLREAEHRYVQAEKEALEARQAEEAVRKQCVAIQAELEAAQKALKLAAPEMAEFKVIFGQAQEALNKAVDALWKLPADKVDGGVRAVKALLDRAGKRLEEERYEAVMPE